MELWIWITLVAATTQTLRSAGQKQMKSVMGDFGASYIRFSYALPFACAWLYAVMVVTGQVMPQTTSDFWLWVSIGGMTQVIFTVLLITLFNHRNFAAGTAFSKTEILQAETNSYRGALIELFFCSLDIATNSSKHCLEISILPKISMGI